MILYHFTAAHLAPKIAREGITMGFVLTNHNPVERLLGYMWLTSNPSFDQAWDEKFEDSLVPYSRCAVRFTVEIPRLVYGRLHRWQTAGPRLCKPSTYRLLSSHGDPENWYLYGGKIRRSWLTDYELAPEQVDLLDTLRPAMP